MTRYGDYESKDDQFQRDLYRQVFMTYEGRKVLSLILADLGIYEPARDQADTALRNYGVYLLERIGVFHEDNLEKITSALLGVNVYFPSNENAGDI